MDVRVITEGGKAFGMGHLTRCASLCDAFKEREVIPLVIVNGDISVGYFFRDNKKAFFNWIKDKERSVGILKNASIVIVDSYLAPRAFYNVVSDNAVIPAYLDDNKRIDYPKGLVINGAIYADRINYPKRKNIDYLLGSQYTPLRKEFWNVPRRVFKGKIKTVMVSFGGSDNADMTPVILKFLNTAYPDFVKNVIMGKWFQNVKKIERLKTKRVNLIYNPHADDIRDIMLSSDIAISGGGQTLYELAQTGLPTIGICVAANQLVNIRGLEKTGFLKYIGRHDSKNLIKGLARSIEELKDAGLRNRMSGKGRNLIDGKGSLRIVDRLLSDYSKARFSVKKAEITDMSDIFKLSNDDLVRRNSFEPRKIRWPEHVRWFTERLRDKNYAFFVLNVDNKFAGQVRFRIDPERMEATVDISIAKPLRKLGLSHLALDEAIAQLLKVRVDVKQVLAYVKNGNLASMRVFEKCGFTFHKNAVVKGSRVKIYIRCVNRRSQKVCPGK